MAKVVIDPVTRIEGHLRLTCVVENGKVTDAWNTATQFRGFEIFMKDRDPRSAWQFAQRICGVCPTPHAHASTLATEHAMGLERVPDGARLTRNMYEASHVGYDHILWFYLLNAFDYVNVPDALNAKVTSPRLKAVQDTLRQVVESGQLGPFAGHWWDHPGYELSPEQNLELTAHYLEAIEIQQVANDAQAWMGGRFPMVMTFIPGGVQKLPDLEEIQYYKGQMQRVQEFVDSVMLPDLLAVGAAYIDLAATGKGYGNYLSWGMFDDDSQEPQNRLLPAGAIFDSDLGQVRDVDPNEVRLFVKHSYYDDGVSGKAPLEAGQPVRFTEYPPLGGEALPKGKYDWVQSARYGDETRPMEVGPLADVLVAYVAGREEVKKLVDDTLSAIGQAGKPQVLQSNLGRIAARVLREKVNVDNALRWADELLELIGERKADPYAPVDVPDSGEGAGALNAPRGALAHYMRIENGRIGAYAAVPPTNWNFSPRDDDDVRGPLEETLVGTPVADPERPLEILRVVHTFDP